MASDKARREELDTTKEAPKVTIRFESLADKPKDSTQARFECGRDLDEKNRVSGGGGESFSVGKFEMSGEEGKAYESKEGGGGYEGAKREGGEGESKGLERLSLEEISRLRGVAQQNSAEAIRAAQERYEKAEEKASQGLGSATEYAKHKTWEAKEGLSEGAQRTVQGTQTTTEQISDKGRQVKDVALEKTRQGLEAAKETAVKAKDITAEKTQQGLEAAKETAVKAKDATVDSGKGAANYVGQVGSDVKDKTAAAGWTAAHYTTEKTVQGTTAAARAVQGAAGNTAHKAAELLSKPLGAVKDYTARKKQEAQSQLQAKQESGKQGGDYNEESRVHATGGGGGAKEEEEEHSFTETQVSQEGQDGMQQQEGGSSVLGAIGETVAEIAHKTKEMVIGHDQTAGSQGDQTEEKAQ